MLLQGLRSAEVLALNRVTGYFLKRKLRVRGKGNKLRFPPLAPGKPFNCSITICTWNDPIPSPRGLSC